MSLLLSRPHGLKKSGSLGNCPHPCRLSLKAARGSLSCEYRIDLRLAPCLTRAAVLWATSQRLNRSAEDIHVPWPHRVNLTHRLMSLKVWDSIMTFSGANYAEPYGEFR